MKEILNLLLVFSILTPAYIFGAATVGTRAQNLLSGVEEIAEIEDDLIEIARDSIDTSGMIEESSVAYHDFDDDSSYYLYMEKGEAYPLENFSEDDKAGNYKKILAEAEKVLADYPDAPDGKYNLAYAKYFLKDYRGAADLLMDLATDYPSNNSIFNFLIAVSLEDGQDIVALFDKKVRRKMEDNYYFPIESIDAIYLLAALAMENGYLLNALEYLDELEKKLGALDAEEINECFIDSYHIDMHRVVTYMYMGEYQTALKLLDSMKEWDRDEAWYANRFGCLRGINGLKSSLEFEKKTVEEHPEIASFSSTLIADLSLAGKYDQAIAEADRIIRTGTPDEDDLSLLYLRRGMANKLWGKNEEAEKDFLKVIELCAETENGTGLLAKSFLGRKDEVLNIFDQFDYDEAFQASVYNVLGMTEKALEKLGNSYEKCRWSPMRSKFDINHVGLLSHPSFAEIAEKFRPDKRKF